LTAAAHVPPQPRPPWSREKGGETNHRHLIAIALVLCLPALPAAQAAGASSERAPVVVRVTGGGFNWGDAVIGAAGGSGLTLLVGGAVLGTRRGANETEQSS
jgi:hypothetical protein